MPQGCSLPGAGEQVAGTALGVCTDIALMTLAVADVDGVSLVPLVTVDLQRLRILTTTGFREIFGLVA